MVRLFGKLIQPYARRIRLMVSRGVIRLVNDGLKLQEVQIALLADETRDTVERFQEYGFTSVPHPGAEAVFLSVGGSRDHGIVIAIDDRRYRLKGLQSGEAALYDDLGQKVHLTRDGIVAESPLQITAISPEINLGGERAGLLALIDERLLELFNNHTHPGVKSGPDTSSPPLMPITTALVCTVKVKAA